MEASWHFVAKALTFYLGTVKLTGKEGGMKKHIRILLVDEHELVRHGLRHMLESEEDMEVVGDCANAEEAFSQMAGLSPDIVLMDIQMPAMNGIEATRYLKRNELDANADVIVLAECADYLVEALEAGAAGYLLKEMTRAELVQAIRQVYSNKHSSKERDGLVEEAVELVIPPPADAAQLLKFTCQLAEILHDGLASIICTVGSWDRGTTITIRPNSTTHSDLAIALAQIAEVEKVEEEPLTRGMFSGLPKKFNFLPRLGINPSKRLRVTLKETSMARQELATVSN